MGKKCTHTDGDKDTAVHFDGYCPLCLTAELEAAKAELQQARERERWTPIKKKLPVGGKKVMLYNAETGVMIVGSADHGRSDGTHVFEIFQARDCTYYSGDFTHWRPLPNPPDKEAHAT